MLKNAKRLMFASAVIGLLAVNAFGQDASLLWLTLDDHAGTVQTMYYGNATLATYCVDDGSGATTNYFESIAPPAPPSGWDTRWKGVRTTLGNACVVDGLFPRDYRAVPVNAIRRDTFKLFFGNIDIPDSSVTITWPDNTYLSAHCDSMFFVYLDPVASTNVKVDMMTQGTWDIPSATINGAYIFLTIYKFGKPPIIIDDVKNGLDKHPKEFSLKPNYPNPFNPTTNLGYDIPKNSTVDVSIFNVLGQKIATLVTGQVAEGAHTAVWNGTTQNGSPVTSGVYFARMTARADGTGEVFTALRKLLLMK
jgi:hypothetical protein